MAQFPPLPERLERLFQRAKALPPARREAFLKEQVDDPAQRAAILRHLAQAAEAPSGEQPTVTLDTGSTRHAPDASQTGDFATLPTSARDAAPVGSAEEPIGNIGEYDLLEEVARGGMGVVFKARHKILKRLVAIKIPRAGQLEDEGEARFLREAQAAAQLRHPHICPIYEVGRAGKQPFIALAFVEGPTLRQKLRAQPTAREAAEIIAKVATAVHYAHGRGVIHRDIKPSNIMLDAETGEPMLMDFGLAKQLSESDSQVTKSGQVMGTPVYMSPEQAAGRHEDIGPRTDVYSLGTVLYELLTGRPPFHGSTGEVIRQVQTEEPPAPRKLAPTLHRDLETICLKAIAKEPSARYDSAAALAEDLQRFAAGEAILARREGVGRRALRVLRRNKALVAAVVLVAVVGASIAAYFAWGAREASQVAAINRQFNEGLQAEAWDAAHRQHMESLPRALAQHDPAAAEQMRAQLYRHVADRLRTRIASSATLRESDFAAIEQDIDWVAKRDAALAPPLRQQLAARRRAWQTLFELSAPYDNRDDIFPNRRVEVADDEGLRPNHENAERSHVLRTKISSTGNVRLLAEFAGDWKGARQIGLLLHAGENHGYTFRVSAPALGRRNPRSVEPGEQRIWHQMEAGGELDVEILRDGHLLRHTTVRANDVIGKSGELRLQATAEGHWLAFRVASQNALLFEDIYPYVGGPHQHFGLLWPPQATLVSLEAQQQPLPIQPSPLEEGDQLFAQQRWAGALAQYRQQENLAGDDRVRDQARFKAALCLMRLGEDDEAIQTLESLASASDERLRLLAGCQLWLLHLKRGNYQGAEVVFESLDSHYEFDRLTMLVPEADRREILKKTYGATEGFNLYRFSADDLRFLDQVHRVNKLLRPNQNSNERGMFVWQYLRGLHVAGEIDRGIKLAHDYYAAGIGLDANMSLSIMAEWSWMLRQRGRYGDALRRIDERLGNRANANRWQLHLLVERARVKAAQQKWDEAAADLDFFLDKAGAEGDYREFSAACLMRGLLYQRNGQPEKADEIWHRGLYENWRAERGDARQAPNSLTGMQAANALLLGAVCGDRTQEQVSQLISQAIPGQNAGMTARLTRQYSHVLAPAMRNMGDSERGREVIWRVAFQELPLRQLIRQPANLIFLEVTRLGAAPGDWSPEEEEIVWEMMNAGFELYASDRVGMPQAVQVMLTWKGANNLFGWKGVAPSLDPSMRGPAAYVFGHRFLKLGKPDDARQFFQTALADAPKDSRLKELAAAQLAALSDGEPD